MKNRIFSAALAMAVACSLCVPAFATEKATEENPVHLTLTNNETGKVYQLDATKSESSVMRTSHLQDSGESETIVTYSAFAPIPEDAVRTADGESYEKSETGVTARISVSYSISADGKTIKMDRIFGDWMTTSGLYALSNRQVYLDPGSKSSAAPLAEYPVSNHFSYVTYWGFENFTTGEEAPAAKTAALIEVAGTGDSYTLEAEFSFLNLYKGKKAKKSLSVQKTQPLSHSKELRYAYNQTRAEYLLEQFGISPEPYAFAYDYELLNYMETKPYLFIRETLHVQPVITAPSYFVEGGVIFGVCQDQDAVNHLFEFAKSDDGTWVLKDSRELQDTGRYQDVHQSFAEFEAAALANQ